MIFKEDELTNYLNSIGETECLESIAIFQLGEFLKDPIGHQGDMLDCIVNIIEEDGSLTCTHDAARNISQAVLTLINDPLSTEKGFYLTAAFCSLDVLIVQSFLDLGIGSLLVRFLESPQPLDIYKSIFKAIYSISVSSRESRVILDDHGVYCQLVRVIQLLSEDHHGDAKEIICLILSLLSECCHEKLPLIPFETLLQLMGSDDIDEQHMSCVCYFTYLGRKKINTIDQIPRPMLNKVLELTLQAQQPILHMCLSLLKRIATVHEYLFDQEIVQRILHTIDRVLTEDPFICLGVLGNMAYLNINLVEDIAIGDRLLLILPLVEQGNIEEQSQSSVFFSILLKHGNMNIITMMIDVGIVDFMIGLLKSIDDDVIRCILNDFIDVANSKDPNLSHLFKDFLQDEQRVDVFQSLRLSKSEMVQDAADALFCFLEPKP